MDKAFNYLLDALGLNFLAEYFPPPIQCAFWTLCGIIFSISLYRTLTTKRRYKLLAIMGSETTMYIWLAVTVLFIALIFYFALDAVDSNISAQIKAFITSGIGKILIGLIILLLAYGCFKIDDNKIRDVLEEEAQSDDALRKILARRAQENLSGGKWKKIFIIVVGIILSIGFIITGARQIFV